MAGYNYERTACRIYRRPGPLLPAPPPEPIPMPVWTFTVPSGQPINTGVIFGPVEDPEPGLNSTSVLRVYFGCDDGRLYALDINQQQPSLAWTYPPQGSPGIGTPVRSTPTLVQFTGWPQSYGVCFGADNGTVYCVTSEGQLRWSRNIGSMVRGSPVYRKGLGVNGYEVYPAVVIVGSVVNPGGTGRLVALKVNTTNPNGEIAFGLEGWPRAPHGFVGSPSYVPMPLPPGGGYVFIADLGGNLRRYTDALDQFPVDQDLVYTPPAPWPPVMGWPTLTGQGGTLEGVTAYFATGPNGGLGGYLYAVVASTMLAKWNPPRIETARWQRNTIPPSEVQVRLGHIYADPCMDGGGQLYCGTRVAGSGLGWGMFARVNDNGASGVSTVIHDFGQSPQQVGATPCVGMNARTGQIWPAFASSSGHLYVVSPTGGGLIPTPFPIFLGATVGAVNDPYGARPHVVLDHQGILYIGNNAGRMGAYWAPY